MEETLRRWGANIREAREAQSLKLSDLAAAVGVSVPTASRWEAGLRAPRDTHKLRIARALNADVAVLFPLDDGAAA